MKQYIHIKSDGSVAVVDIPKEGDAEYRQLSELVGGYIEQIRAWGDHRVVVNEEGLLKGLPMNYAACLISGRDVGAPLVGEVVLVGPIRADGEFDTVHPDVVEAFKENWPRGLIELVALGPGRAGIAAHDEQEYTDDSYEQEQSAHDYAMHQEHSHGHE